MSGKCKAPFPWFGGKSGAARMVWGAFGDVKNYVEPFFGSGAVLLDRPNGPGKVETVNDADGLLANFWRAMTIDPDAVAFHAEWPVNEADLHARHWWLVSERETLTSRLMGDADWFDAKAAGWWVWGQCAWIGTGWCSGEGPWVVEGGGLVKQSGRSGVSKKLPHLGDAGQGIAHAHLADVAARMRRVRVACGDWKRVVASSTLTWRHGLTGVFLDPPYKAGEQQYSAGGTGTDLADRVAEWCVTVQDNPLMRVALCGQSGDYDLPGWRTVTWKRKGYAKTEIAKARLSEDTIWFSPHCLPSAS